MNAASRFPSIPPPPRGADLPTEDGIPMETPLHRLLMTLLIETLEMFWADRKDFYVGGNMFFYYSEAQSKRNDFRGPDLFVVLGTEHRPRDSWVMWEEDSQAPNFILEITSPSTEAIDRGDKMRIYGQVLRIPEYFIYDPRTGVLEGYRLGPGPHYKPISPNADGRFLSEQLGLLLGVEEGIYLTTHDRFVRWYTSDGKLIRTQQEHAARLAEQIKEYEQRLRPLEHGAEPAQGEGGRP